MFFFWWNMMYRSSCCGHSCLFVGVFAVFRLKIWYLICFETCIFIMCSLCTFQQIGIANGNWHSRSATALCMLWELMRSVDIVVVFLVVFCLFFLFWWLRILDQVLYITTSFKKIWSAAPRNPPRCKLETSEAANPSTNPVVNWGKECTSHICQKAMSGRFEVGGCCPIGWLPIGDLRGVEDLGVYY